MVWDWQKPPGATAPDLGERARHGPPSRRRRLAAGDAARLDPGRPVIVATGAYSGMVKPSPLGYFRRRIISVGSFIVATRPLSDDEIARTLPGNRTYVTSLNIGNYFRLSPDKRMIFGGGRASPRPRTTSRTRSRRIAARKPDQDVPAHGGGRDRLLLGWPGRHDHRPLPARRDGGRHALCHGIFRPRRAAFDADGTIAGGHGHGARGHQPAGRHGLAAGPGSMRASRGSCPWWDCISA